MNPDSENNQAAPNNNTPAQPQEYVPPSPGEAIRPPEPASTAQVPPSVETPLPASPVPPANNTVPEIFPSDPIGPVSGNIKPSSPKKRLLIILLPIVLLLLIAGYVFGYYIPNKPENVYKTGLDRSGQALKIVLDKATEQETYNKFKKTEVTANIEVNSDGQNIKGDFKAKFDESKLDTDLNVSFPGQDSKQANLGLSILSKTDEGKEFPDTYLNVRGIKALGADLFLPGIGKYDNKWVAISSDYLSSIADKYGIEANQNKDNTKDYPTADEVSSLIRDAYAVTDEYVFTSDTEKSVFVNKQYLGKEDVEGVGTYHYEVGIDKGNYKEYCEAVSKVFLDSQAYKKLFSKSDQQVEADKQNIGDECQKSSDGIKDDQTFEMWIDSKYKLIKKIRVYSNKDDKGEYFEFGQNYDGGDKISFFIATVSDKGGFSSKTTFTTDLNTGESSGELTFNGGSDTGKYDGKITLTAKPLSGDFDITPPSGAVKIEKVLKDIGIDPAELASFYGGRSEVATGINDQSNDALIKSNINSLYAQLEVYFAMNGYYPTEAQVNNQSWRADNMKGLSEDVFSPPLDYSPSDCEAGGCQKFTLSADLSTGEKFTKTGSNN